VMFGEHRNSTAKRGGIPFGHGTVSLKL
jgi:hypothetical protein